MIKRLGLYGAVALCLTLSGEGPAGDAQRGRELFFLHNCSACHSVDGKGGGVASDLAKRIGRDSSPAAVAAQLWSRGPAMWAAIEKRRLPAPLLTEQDAADLFAYFYSARFFDRPGDAARGKRVFEWKHCAECHHSAPGSPGRPPSEWPPIGDSIALLERMWNAGAQMKAALKEKRITWPELGAQEITDLAAYVEGLPATPRPPGEFPLPTSQPGAALFARNCKGCHSGARSLAYRFSGRTLTEWALAMWNTLPQMGRKPPALEYGEMRRLTEYLWTLQLVEPPGDAQRGRQVYKQKNCSSCHGKPLTGAPALADRPGALNAFAMTAAFWQHGPNMLKKYGSNKAAWPRFTTAEMADLLAYLSRGTLPAHSHR